MGRSERFPSHITPLLAILALVCGVTVPTGRAWAQIVINEIYPDPAGTDDPLERIEIYNAGTTAVDVTGWCIHDAATIDGNPAPARCRLPEDFDSAACPGGAILQPGEFRLVKATSGLAWLNNSGGDDVYLCSNRTIPATIVHQVTYPTTVGHTDEVWAALPNGTSNFAWRAKTLCASNGGVVGDVTPPATVSDLVAAAGAFPGEILLRWTAPGDDGASGTASLYHIKVSAAPITAGNFAAASEIDLYVDEPLPRLAGAAESLFVYGLTPGSTFYFALETQDEVPNTSGVSNSPGTAALAGSLLDPDLGYSTYFGNLHSHTSYSDGVQTPPDAYTFARYTAQTPLDFLCVSDHNHADLGMTPAKYQLGMSAAAAANDDGNFVAIYGQEWGVIANGGHVILFEAPVLFGWNPGVYDVFVAQSDYASLYTAALANPPASYPVIAEWCHPALSDFNNMQVTADGQSIVHLMALVNGPAFSTATDESDIGNTGFDDSFNEALRRGYRVSPTGDQDNHNATWGNSSESRTAVLALARTKSAILSAMAARRTYATQDHNAVLRFSADGRPMGSAFASTAGIRIAASVTDPDVGESVAQIDLFRGFTGGTSAVRVAGNTGSASFQWRERQTFTAGTEAHYYLRVRMADNQNLWSGPVYVTYQPASQVAVGETSPRGAGLALSSSPNPSAGRVTVEYALPHADARVTVAVYDLSGRRTRTLVNGPVDAGVHRIPWDGLAEDGSRSSAGIFFLRLETSTGRIERKVLLLR